jgi:anti-anti-sigma factor
MSGIDPSNTLVVRAPAELDSGTAPAFRDELALALSHVPWLVVDMTETTFIDSSGMGALVAAQRLATSRGGALSVRGVSDRVETTLRLAGLATHLNASPEPPTR